MNDTDLQKWQTNSSKYLVKDRWLTVRADTCTTPEGHVIEPFYVLEYSDWANCFVIDENNDILMVRHYRHGVDEYVLELVSGGLELIDNSPESGMRRELEEELGYLGGDVMQIGTTYPNASSQTNKLHSFLAIGGSCRQAQKLEPGENLQIVRIPLKEFAQLLSPNNAEIFQSTHLVTMFLALEMIRRSELPALKELRKLL